MLFRIVINIAETRTTLHNEMLISVALFGGELNKNFRIIICESKK